MRLLGVVLAGGRSSRFGSDKALALYRGRTLLDHAIAALQPLVAEIVLAGRTHPHLRTVADCPHPDLGPLGGLNGALALAADEGFEAVLSVPCDVPELDAAALRPLLETGGTAIFSDLPVCGYWPTLLAPALDARLRSGVSRSAGRWATACAAVLVRGPGLVNINATDDLAGLS